MALAMCLDLTGGWGGCEEGEAWRSKEEPGPYHGAHMENKTSSWPSGSTMGINQTSMSKTILGKMEKN